MDYLAFLYVYIKGKLSNTILRKFLPEKLRDEGVPRPPCTEILRKKIPTWAEHGIFALDKVKSKA